MNAFRDEPFTRQWLRVSLGVGGGAILVVLLARTAVGAIDRQPEPVTIALLAAAGFGLALTVWRLDDSGQPQRDARQRTVRAAVAVLGALLFGLLVARESLSGLASVVMMAIVWAVAAALRIRQPAVSGRSLKASGTTSREGDAPAEPREIEDHRCDAARQEPGDDPSLQLLLRRHRDENGERIELQARLEFVAGAREAVLHVPLWPALPARPVVECEPLDGDEIELRVTSAEPYGVRIEGRLATAAIGPRTILIGVEIRASTDRSRSIVAA